MQSVNELAGRRARYHARKAQDPTWYAKVRARGRKVSRAYVYAQHGLTEAEFQRMLDAQSGVCAICFTKVTAGEKSCHIDHDHITGDVRGVLCRNCNVGLGHFKDSPG